MVEREVKVTGWAAHGLPRWIFSLCWLVLAMGVVRTALAADEVSILERYPGRMIQVGDHRLHLMCLGQGGPTVVFEAGIGGFSLEWRTLQERLAVHQRACAYDRAGYGWSDFVDAPADAARSADELHELLNRAGERGPYLLVAHSYGGFIARWFARRHGGELAALVLLDSSSPEQFERLPAAALPTLPPGPARRAMRMPRLPDGFPAAQGTTALALMLLPKARLATLAELRGFAASAHALAALPAVPLPVPVLIISRGRREFDDAAGGTTSEALWRAMQTAMTQLSPHAAQWIARGAGHLVHLERPDLVLRAVASVTAAGGAGALHGLSLAATANGPPP
jgi:pimeloyl-ACP methyl ester carboxylesterase